jgi:hypothetical protein
MCDLIESYIYILVLAYKVIFICLCCVHNLEPESIGFGTISTSFICSKSINHIHQTMRLCMETFWMFKIQVFSSAELCQQVSCQSQFWRSILLHGLLDTKDGGSLLFPNICNNLPFDTAYKPRKLGSSSVPRYEAYV